MRQLNSPEVPVSDRSIDLMMSYFDQTGPEKIREEIVVAVDAADAAQFQLDMVQGRLRRISPEELDHAIVLYIAKLVECGEDDESLQYFADRRVHFFLSRPY